MTTDAATGPDSRPAYLIVIPWELDHVGGVNQVVIHLAQELQRAGRFRPIVMIADWRYPAPQCDESGEIPVVRWRVRHRVHGASLLQCVRQRAWERGFRSDFRRWCEAHRVQVVNAHYPGPTTLTLQRAIGDAPNAPRLVVSFHGADLTGIADDPLQRTDWQAAATGRLALTACSHQMATRVDGVLGSTAHTQAVHNGIDANSFAVSGDNIESPDALPARYILSVAKFEQKKGLDLLIQAYAAMRRGPSDPELVLVGAAAGELEPLRALAQRLGVGPQVHFFIDIPHARIAPFFRGAELFVLPSRVEPFGIVLLEAAVFGVPVLATRTGGIPEIVPDDGGLLVPVEDTAAMAAGLRRLVDDPVLRAHLGQRLQAHARASFSWRRTHDRYVEIATSPSAAGGRPRPTASLE